MSEIAEKRMDKKIRLSYLPRNLFAQTIGTDVEFLILTAANSKQAANMFQMLGIGVLVGVEELHG